MPRRLIRLFPLDFTARLAEFEGLDLNVVGRDGVTLRGRLVSHDSQSLNIQDGRQQRHQMRFAELEEIVIDKLSFTELIHHFGVNFEVWFPDLAQAHGKQDSWLLKSIATRKSVH